MPFIHVVSKVQEIPYTIWRIREQSSDLIGFCGGERIDGEDEIVEIDALLCFVPEEVLQYSR